MVEGGKPEEYYKRRVRELEQMLEAAEEVRQMIADQRNHYEQLYNEAAAELHRVRSLNHALGVMLNIAQGQMQQIRTTQ